MAENRGGNRPTAPQNNFAVSATGGAGNAGKQPSRYTAGMDNAAEYQAMQTAAPLNSSGVQLPTGRGGSGAPVMPVSKPTTPITPLSAPTNYPDEPITTGIDSGPGAGSEVMATPSMLAAQSSQDQAKIAAYLPVYAKIAELPNATNATRNFYRWLRSQS